VPDQLEICNAVPKELAATSWKVISIGFAKQGSQSKLVYCSSTRTRALAPLERVLPSRW